MPITYQQWIKQDSTSHEILHLLWIILRDYKDAFYLKRYQKAIICHLMQNEPAVFRKCHRIRLN
jgi:hypothetical protein